MSILVVLCRQHSPFLFHGRTARKRSVQTAEVEISHFSNVRRVGVGPVMVNWKFAAFWVRGETLPKKVVSCFARFRRKDSEDD